MKNYRLIQKIGEGSFSSVYKAQNLIDCQIYCLKIIKTSNLSKQQVQNCYNEIHLLSQINHPNIISYKQSFYEDGKLHIVMEYAQNGDLFTHILDKKKSKSKFTEQQICVKAREMVNAINVLHQLNIIHRDIKPSNFLLDKNNKMKLSDMNISKITQNGLAQTKIGTPYYTSPEIWLQKQYGTKSDIWAFGCLLYEMITCQMPFKGRDIAALKDNILKGHYTRLPQSISNELKSIVEGCLAIDPQERSSSIDLLNNAYIKKKYQQIRFQTIQKNVISRTDQLKIRSKIFSNINRQLQRKLNQSKDLNISYQNNKKQINAIQTEQSKQKKFQKSVPKKLTSKMMRILNIYSQTPIFLRKNKSSKKSYRPSMFR